MKVNPNFSIAGSLKFHFPNPFIVGTYVERHDDLLSPSHLFSGAILGPRVLLNLSHWASANTLRSPDSILGFVFSPGQNPIYGRFQYFPRAGEPTLPIVSRFVSVLALLNLMLVSGSCWEFIVIIFKNRCFPPGRNKLEGPANEGT